MKAYIICCNDSVELVVLNDEGKAEGIKEEMAKADFKRSTTWKDYEEYRNICYWHLHDVEYIL